MSAGRAGTYQYPAAPYAPLLPRPAPPSRSFLSANSLTQASMVADAQATLTGSMTMHALDATGPATPFFLPGAVCGDASLQELIAASGGGAVAVPVPAAAPAAAEDSSKFIGAFAAGGGAALPATSTESAFVTTDL